MSMVNLHSWPKESNCSEERNYKFEFYLETAPDFDAKQAKALK
jgi:hypothetical protein